MIEILNSETGAIIGTVVAPYNPRQLDSIRNLINVEYGFGYSVSWKSK